MHLEKKIDIGKVRRIPVSVWYPNYGLLCVFALFILIYANVVFEGDNNFTFTILGIAFISCFLGIRLKRREFLKLYKQQLSRQELSSYMLTFSDDAFTHGFAGGTTVILPYKMVTMYKINKRYLVFETGNGLYLIERSVLNQEEIDHLIEAFTHAAIPQGKKNKYLSRIMKGSHSHK